VSRLLETVCALTVGVLVALLVWGADPGTLRAAWREGELSGVTVVFVAACALWLVLWRRRTGRGRVAWPLVVLLCGAAVALVVAAMAG
jgi:L-lactate permease